MAEGRFTGRAWRIRARCGGVVEGQPSDAPTSSSVAPASPTRRRWAGVVLRRLTAGSMFGETAVLSGGIRTATVEAEEAVTVKVIPRQLLEENPGRYIAFGLFAVAPADRFRELDGRLDELRKTPPEGRGAGG